MTKKRITILLVVLAITCLTGTGIYLAIAKTKKNHKVEIAPLEYVCTPYYDMDTSERPGITYTGGGQNVYVNSEDVISRILVKEGDLVEAGTPLLQLDTNKLKLELDSCKLSVEQDNLDIQLANKMLAKYQNAIPYEETETEPEENTEEEVIDIPSGISTDNVLSEINHISQAFEGDGSAENPYKIKIQADARIFAPLFKTIEKEGKYVTLYIYSSDIDEFAYTCSLSPSGKNIAIKKNYTWSPGSIYELADGTKTIQLNSTLPPIPCSFASYVPEDYDDLEEEPEIEEPETEEPETEEPDDETTFGSMDGIYTQKELNEMINEKRQEIAELTIQKREHELEVKKAQSKYDKATITSTIKGVVTSVNETALGTDPVIVISDGTGLYVRTSIDEYSLPEIQTGDTLTITSWSDNGNSQFEAKITDISPYPFESDSYSYSSNQNISSYPVTAYIEESEGLHPDDYVSISYGSFSNGESEIYAIDKAYVGEENGKHFLYLVNDEERLEKTYIKTGKTVYDSYLQILDEIDLDGYIASPYSKYAEDGAKADMNSADNIY